jgi:hypothetical protein
MAFDKESVGYEKTVLSDFQGAWENLRDAVVEHAGFTGWERALLHIDEGMSWESVRNLRYMSKCLLLVRNILMQGEAVWSKNSSVLRCQHLDVWRTHNGVA